MLAGSPPSEVRTVHRCVMWGFQPGFPPGYAPPSMQPGMMPMQQPMYPQPGMMPMQQPMYPQPGMMPMQQPMMMGMHETAAQMTTALPNRDSSVASSVASRSNEVASESRQLRRKSTRSRTPIRGRKDDKHTISTSFRTLGCAHLHDKPSRSCSNVFRASLCNAADTRRFPMMRLCQLSNEQLDMMNYIVCGLNPTTRPASYGCDSKRDMRVEARSQAEERLKAMPGRWNMLSDEWDNIESVAMKLSYSPEWLMPDTYELWANHRGRTMERVIDRHPHGQPALTASPRRDSPVRLTDGPQGAAAADSVRAAPSRAAAPPANGKLAQRRLLEKRALSVPDEIPALEDTQLEQEEIDTEKGGPRLSKPQGRQRGTQQNDTESAAPSSSPHASPPHSPRAAQRRNLRQAFSPQVESNAMMSWSMPPLRPVSKGQKRPAAKDDEQPAGKKPTYDDRKGPRRPHGRQPTDDEMKAVCDKGDDDEVPYLTEEAPGSAAIQLPAARPNPFLMPTGDSVAEDDEDAEVEAELEAEAAAEEAADQDK